jgi:hypothetical protein
MTAQRRSERGILVGTRFWRDIPDPPSRPPEREGGGPGKNRWFFSLLGTVLAVSLLGRFLGPIGLILVWGLILLGFVIVNWTDRKR